MNNSVLQNILLFIGLLLLQVTVLNNVLFWGYLNPFLYVLFVIVYPYRKEKGIFLLLCFLLGLCVDFFTNSGGVNAAATLFIGYIRLSLLKKILRKQEIDFPIFDITKQPFSKLFPYVAILIFLHSFIIFILEYFSFKHFTIITTRVLATTIFTFILVIFSIILLSRKK